MTAENEAVDGRRIDRYELRELIGEGGMGAVYRAVDSRLGRTVALKTVVAHRSGPALPEELRQRFMREALAASRVEHRNVVQVIDFGLAADGTPYLVMEYLRGQDLGALLRKTKEPLAIEYVADVMLGVCAALRACHQVGIVHRDLKPSNIFLADTDTGAEVKVLDFGVSKAPAAEDLTQEGQILGTPQYLSPEQVNGKVGPESDQYALGVLLYVCLTKRLPFEEHQNLSLLRAIDLGRFDSPRLHRPDIPAALEAVILRAMHTSPAERFESVHALGQKLWDFASARGQVEWKNYYFHTPPAPLPPKSTLRGVPFELERATTPPQVLPLAATELLKKAASEPVSAIRPQLMVSTKLARPESRRGEAADAPSDGSGDAKAGDGPGSRGGLRWLFAMGLLGVAVGGLYATRHRGPAGVDRPGAAAAPSHVIASPMPVAAPDPAAAAAPKPAAAATPPSPAEAPRQAANSRPSAIQPPPDNPSISSPTRQTHRKKPARGQRRSAPRGGAAPNISLDRNGIGIPAN